MKILILGGMHGNEPLGPAVVKRFKKKPVDSVDVLIANPRALTANVRFTEEDLNRSFPGEATSKVYERRRARQLLKLCEGYDVVFDFHNTTCPGNDCSFVGQTSDARLRAISARFGLKRVVVADYDCINKYVPRCISIEISLSSVRNDPAWWYEQIAALAQLKTLPKEAAVTLYRFAYRMTLEDKERLGLPALGLKAFKPLSPEVAEQLGVTSPAYPIFIGDTYTPYNYGGVLQLIDV